jgi:hypothetical protein
VLASSGAAVGGIDDVRGVKIKTGGFLNARTPSAASTRHRGLEKVDTFS